MIFKFLIVESVNLTKIVIKIINLKYHLNQQEMIIEKKVWLTSIYILC